MKQETHLWLKHDHENFFLPDLFETADQLLMVIISTIKAEKIDEHRQKSRKSQKGKGLIPVNQGNYHKKINPDWTVAVGGALIFAICGEYGNGIVSFKSPNVKSCDSRERNIVIADDDTDTYEC